MTTATAREILRDNGTCTTLTVIAIGESGCNAPNTICEGDSDCVDGICVLQEGENTCIDDGDCEGDLVCDNGICTTLTVIAIGESGCNAPNTICEGDSGCVDGICVLQEGENTCYDNGDCGGDLVCDNGTCTTLTVIAIGESGCNAPNTICEGDSGCVDGICVLQEGEGTCFDSGDCKGDLVCDNGTCTMCKDGFEKKGDACVKSGIKYGEPIVLKLDVDVIDRYLSGGRSRGNEVVDTRDFRCSDYEKSVFRHHYTWYFASTIDSKNDEKAGEPVKYGDTVYLQVLSNRWLSGGRSSGNNGVVARDFFKNSYEQSKAAVTYRFTVRSTLGNGKLGVSSRNPDPKAGEVVIPGCRVVLQLAGGLCNRWLTGGRGHGNKGVFTRDFYCSAYEQSHPGVYTWRPLLADEVRV